MSLKFVVGESRVVADGISTLRPGSVFKQKDITETQMKNTLMPAVTYGREERERKITFIFQLLICCARIHKSSVVVWIKRFFVDSVPLQAAIFVVGAGHNTGMENE